MTNPSSDTFLIVFVLFQFNHYSLFQIGALLAKHMPRVSYRRGRKKTQKKFDHYFVRTPGSLPARMTLALTPILHSSFLIAH
jgi:hypothetical protein